MQVHDLPCNPSSSSLAANPHSDPHFAMADPQSSSPSPIHSPKNSHNNGKNSQDNDSPPRKKSSKAQNDGKVSDTNSKSSVISNNSCLVRRERPSRACTQRAAERMQAAAAAEAAVLAAEKRQKKAALRRERLTARLVREELDEDEEDGGRGEEDGEDEEGGDGEDGASPLNTGRNQQCSKMVTPLVGEPEPSQLPRWNIRGMWQLASILNFLNVFRPLLNIKVEFSVEEFETALITPNNTLAEIHIPLLKSIPPVTRMALGHNTWVTVLCRKIRDWWLWVAEGELPIVASHGTEIETYNSLEPSVRVIILKALCDIRVEQEDIRNHIDNSIKHGIHLSSFRKERIGGDSHGVSYWYEDDPIVGHRLYREIRKVEVKKGKGRNIPPIPSSSYQWETVATNFDEFQDVSEKLFSSKNRTEFSVGKKLKNDMLPEIEKVHKKREKLLKKQHRQALMLDNMMNMDGLAAGRSLRDRKPVTYTFDDYDRSINEAIKITKKQPSPLEFMTTRREGLRYEAQMNGRWGSGPSVSFNEHSPKSDYDGYYDDNGADHLDRSNRRRQRPQRYSEKEFVEAVSDNDADFDSDDDIVGEVIYDDEYLRKRKQRRKMSSSSEGDDEYHYDDDNPEEEEEEEYDDADSLSASEESDGRQQFKKLPGRTRRETKLRSVGDLQFGLRRSNRATRNQINYRKYELSESETESAKPGKSEAVAEYSNESEDADKFSMASQDSEDNTDDQEMKVDQPVDEPADADTVKQEENHLPEKADSPRQTDGEGVQKRRFLDLNELAPGSGFDDGPNSMMKDEDGDEF
ncbi:OLC1v1012843C1 [Oldenlandia corymbosa var. corymbosa]|uniref:OLC1v1012843C1 n=1 Tax=Oldenlandia corymbosa var. corymbosa TaxID=529605 RepID=A0AAV1DWY3_OLDCO|nr:OLC1v1012843C1 [Oldenlandia corymbosa var. corymbosa]